MYFIKFKTNYKTFKINYIGFFPLYCCFASYIILQEFLHLSNELCINFAFCKTSEQPTRFLNLNILNLQDDSVNRSALTFASLPSCKPPTNHYKIFAPLPPPPFTSVSYNFRQLFLKRRFLADSRKRN